MRRRTFLTGLGALGTATLVGCGSKSEDEYVADPGSLQVYSAQHENLTKAWAEAFTKETGIKVQVRKGGDSSMGHQLVAEGAESPADVFLTENSPAMTLVERNKLLAPLEDATRNQVPANLTPSSKAWTAIAARSTVLVYNPAKLPDADLPKSLMDLSGADWKDRWGCAPGGADFQAIVAGMLAGQGEQKTKDWLKGLKSNARALQNNIATMKSVNAGEIPCGVIYHYYWYRDQAGTKEGSGNTKLHYFRNQDPGAFVSLSGGAVLAGAKKPAEARKFLQYITSKAGQKVLVDSQSMEYAVGTGVPSAPALPPLATLQAPPVDPFTLNSDQVTTLMTDAGIL
ncbi:iron ABC transporter substrate-binding protein [Kribbella shirazensis]|uniref:Iron(III) transport system substrate-binding protein n=1 Tax=Kribbella shirazensis TaxID=1105143 RepID=A0A7X5VE30_9ACTN|nr:iron ABC transporter substrate-binding protein [Kribbella shirazensis]NIK59086.1 iron(III) transport system substrate-binding protein [Kribbella shirazensis]